MEYFGQINEINFFLPAHGTFPKIDHILSYKKTVNRYKEIEITPCILSNHHGLKLNSNDNKMFTNS